MNVVMANGCFDPFHYGHLLHLKAARSMGDKLVVALTSDHTLREEKGPHRPLFDQDQRKAMLYALSGIVDRVVVVHSTLHALRMERPDILVKGSDYGLRTMQWEILEHCLHEGIAVRFTDTPKWSATVIGEALRA